MNELSPKQRELIDFSQSDGKISISVGAIRSGKTFANILAFVLYTQSLPSGYTHFILGRKRSVIETELLPHVYDVCKVLGLKYQYKRMDMLITAGNQKYVVAAGNDELSFSRLQGLTCSFYYC